jgi:protein translocase SEC61 complex gamma subunit
MAFDLKLDIKEQLSNYRRVLQVARKPNIDEYKKIAKVCALGMMLVGAIGFVTYAMSVMLIG